MVNPVQVGPLAAAGTRASAGHPDAPRGSPEPGDDGPRRSLHGDPLRPWVVLVAGLLLSVSASLVVGRLVEARAQERFHWQGEAVRTTLARRLDEIELALRGAVALFDASYSVERGEWRRYVASLDLAHCLPGVEGIGYAQVIAPDALAAHEQAVRSEEGVPQYGVHPGGVRSIYAPIVYPEPFDTRGQRALGFDLWSEPAQREAMERARDSGQAAVSGVAPQGTDGGGHPGFLLYLPVYRQGASTETVAGRRAALQGFVYAFVCAKDLMSALFKGWGADIALDVYDGHEPVSGSRLYGARFGSAGPSPIASPVGVQEQFLPLEVGGRPWTLRVSASRVVILADRALPATLGFGGALASLLLFLYLRALARTRVLAEEQLRGRDALLRAVAGTSKDGFYVVDTTGQLLEVNDAYCQQSGYTRDALLGMNVHDLDAFETAEQTAAHIDEILRMGGDLFETRHRRRDGSTWPLEVSVTYCPDLGGRLVSFCRDISERKEAEARLQAYRDQLEAQVAARTRELEATHRQMRDTQYAMDRAGFGVMWIDPRDNRVIYSNQHGAEMLGYAMEELLGLTISDLDPRYDTSAVDSVNREVQARGTLRFETHWRHQDGHEIPMEITLYPMASDASQGPRVVGFLSDITQRKHAEAVLAVQAARTQALLELPALAEQLGESEFMQRSLDHCERLTGSTVSFIHLVHDDQEHLELVAWSRATLETHCRACGLRHHPVSQAGLWAEALRQRRPLIFNDYASAEGKHGLPPGHAELRCLVSVPVFENGKVVLMAGVGNKAASYTDLDVETVQLVCNDVWRAVQRQRSLRQLQSLYQAMEQSGESIVT